MCFATCLNTTMSNQFLALDIQLHSRLNRLAIDRQRSSDTRTKTAMANFCLQLKLGTQRVFILEPLAWRQQHVLATGVPSIILWTACGSVWQENSFHVGIIKSDSVLPGTRVCKRSVFAILPDLGSSNTIV